MYIPNYELKAAAELKTQFHTFHSVNINRAGTQFSLGKAVRGEK